MFKFSLIHMAVRFGKNLLIIISIIITLTVSLLAYNISNQVKDGIVQSYKYYDTIVGPIGSQTQLVLNTLFYTDKPLGIILFSDYEKILNDKRISVAIPFAMGDNYNNSRIVGTVCEYMREFSIIQGVNFSESYQVVVGYNVFKEKGLKLGDTFFGVHGLTTDVNSHSHDDVDEKYTVVGILAKTGTAADNVIFTDLSGIWETHGISDEHDDEKGLTSILIKCTDFNAQNSLSAEYNKIPGMQAINPSVVMRELMNNVDLTKNIVYVLCAVILIMNLFIICIITMLNMYDIKKDIVMLRLIGVSKMRIEMIIYIQSLIISVISVLLGLGLSRILLKIIGYITQSMGIVLDINKFYGFELIIIGIIILMTFFPIIISVKKIFMEKIYDEK